MLGAQGGGAEGLQVRREGLWWSHVLGQLMGAEVQLQVRMEKSEKRL